MDFDNQKLQHFKDSLKNMAQECTDCMGTIRAKMVIVQLPNNRSTRFTQHLCSHHSLFLTKLTPEIQTIDAVLYYERIVRGFFKTEEQEK